MKQRAVVVGGGVLGRATAWFLAERGLKVTLVDANHHPGKASLVAGGMLAPQVECKEPSPLVPLALASRGAYPGFLERLQAVARRAVPSSWQGILVVASSEAHAEELRKQQAWQHEQGLHAQWLTTEGLRALEPELAPAPHGALFLPDDGQVDAAMLTDVLGAALQSVGVEHLVDVPAERLLTRGGAVTGVVVPGRTLGADVVALTAGSWSSRVEGTGLASKAVRPVRGQMLVLQANGPLLRRPVFSSGGYLVPRLAGSAEGHHDVLVGATMEEAGYDARTTAKAMHGLLDVAMRALPALSTASLREGWAGLRPASADGLPILGRSPISGLLVAAGHLRNGILLTPITAKVMAHLALGEEPGVDLGAFSPSRPALAAPA
ncbi:MAG: glycine oxidase ThiO [Myxococcota bacterium]